MTTKPFSSTAASADAQPGTELTALDEDCGVLDAQEANASANTLAPRRREMFDTRNPDEGSDQSPVMHLARWRGEKGPDFANPCCT